MRLFGSNRNRDEDESRPDPEEDTSQEESQTPELDDSPEHGPEPSIPEGANLDDLYDESGEARFEDEFGNPCTEDGHPIFANREEAEAALPEPHAPEEPETKTPSAPTGAFRSPFADGLLSEEERAQAEALVDPSQLRLIETIAARTADRIVAAREQQRMAARGLDVEEEVYDELAPRISQIQHFVPESLRGTRKGAMAELALAALSEAMETDDFSGAFARFAPRIAQTEEEKPRKVLLPPSARVTSPRANPETVTRTLRRSRDVASESLRMDGIEGDALAIMRRERKVGRF